MEELFKEMDTVLEKLNKNIDDLENIVDDLSVKIKKEQQEFDDYKSYIESNYKSIGPYEMYGVSESDFH